MILDVEKIRPNNGILINSERKYNEIIASSTNGCTS